MHHHQPNNPLHGITLEAIVTRLARHYGWEELGARIPINCFLINPSVRSSLTYLRRTQWVRNEVEALYIATFCAPSSDEPSAPRASNARKDRRRT